MNFQSAAKGLYVTFESQPDFVLALSSFDPTRGAERPQLVAVSDLTTGESTVQVATVFVPDGALGYFFQRFERYVNEDTKKGNPRYKDFVERIATLRLATLQELWTDDPSLFPPPEEMYWWEIWLRRQDGAEVDRLLTYAAGVGAAVLPRRLAFDDRVIVVVHATATQLSRSIDLLDDLAELRRSKAPTEFFTSLPVHEQAAWMTDLIIRTSFPSHQDPAVCLLDTGVNRGHPLLEQALAEEDMLTCNPVWGTADHDGHGTEMAGVALFGDLASALASSGPISLHHALESVKIIGPANDTDRDLYGAVTAEAVSRVEVQAAQRPRVFCLTITAPSDPQSGTPTSWSSAIDALAAGRDFDQTTGDLHYIDEAEPLNHRLFLASTGNVRAFDTTVTHLATSDTSPIEDPAQAWNAISVGAFTELTDVEASGDDWEGFSVMAQDGDLSPFSRTSVAFSRSWPIKPELVCEGGNAAVSPDGTLVDWPDSIQLLTTYHEIASRLFTSTGMTSAATAQAAHLACLVGAEYPSLWSEAIRALLIHSGEWSDVMKNEFKVAGQNKTARESLLRRYGFGVPAAERALRSASDAVTLVVQDTIHPFAKRKLREMHVHDLPWPKEELFELGAAPVRLRVTLSYFVEPNPTRRGWHRRYRYPSHGLRFELKKPLESMAEFRKRINKQALDEDEERPVAGDDGGWYFGNRARTRGSLHSDFWEGTATELAERGSIAIYPVHGWWKEQPSRDRSEHGARYGLVVSIETPVQEIDLWTPVAAQVGVPIEVVTEW